MRKDDLLHFYRNFQVIDITDECSFEWYQEPESCSAYLEVSDAKGDFIEGEVIIGQISGAIATVFNSIDNNKIYIDNVSGDFQDNEVIEGKISGQTATVVRFVPERTYPDNIISGVFPESLINPNEYFGFVCGSYLPCEVWRLLITTDLESDNLYYVIGNISVVGEPANSGGLLFSINSSSKQVFRADSNETRFSFRCSSNSILLCGFQCDVGIFTWKLSDIRVLQVLL